MGQENGRLVVWNETSGYGFIKPDRGGPDVYVHRAEIAAAVIRRGMRVAFNTVVNDGRSQARSVRTR